MTKPLAKCRYSGLCGVYNLGALNEDAERTMCRPGENTSPNYVPTLPRRGLDQVCEEYPHDPTAYAVCDAFQSFQDSERLNAIEDILSLSNPLSIIKLIMRAPYDIPLDE